MNASQPLKRHPAAESTRKKTSTKSHPPISFPARVSSTDTTNGIVAGSSLGPAIGPSASLSSSSLGSRQTSLAGAKLGDRRRSKSQPRSTTTLMRQPYLQTHDRDLQSSSTWSLPSPSPVDQNKSMLGVTANSSQNKATLATKQEAQLADQPRIPSSPHTSPKWKTSDGLTSSTNNRGQHITHHAPSPLLYFHDQHSFTYGRQSNHRQLVDLITESGQMQHNLPMLRPFYPLQCGIDSDHRPKTSRGLDSTHTEISQLQIHHRHFNQYSSRRSAFAEGSMNTSSRGVASSWLDIEPTSTSDSPTLGEDDSVTPRASVSRDGSIDIREFQPSAPTPSKLKGTLLHLGRKSGLINDGGVKETPIFNATSRPQKKPSRILGHGLNFLSEKLRSIGNSGHNDKSDKNSNNSQIDQQAILSERKRKAEEAYATQFGFKKRKDNSGIAFVTSPSLERQRWKATGQRRPIDDAIIRAQPRGRTQSESSPETASMFDDYPTSPAVDSRKSTITQNDYRKRPSRSELEKENRKLRALLKDATQHGAEPVERPGSAMSIHSNKSSIHLPLDVSMAEQMQSSTSDLEPLHVDLTPSTDAPSLSASSKRTSNPSRHRRRSSSSASAKIRLSDAPPVPALPSQIPQRNILTPITGNVARSARGDCHGTISRKTQTDGMNFRLTKTDSLAGDRISPTNKFKLRTTGKGTSTGSPRQQRQQKHQCTVDGPHASLSAPVLLTSKSQLQEGDENMVTKLKADTAINPKFSGFPDPVKHEEQWVWPDDVF